MASVTIWWCVLLCLLLELATASTGDYDYKHQLCLNRCIVNDCSYITEEEYYSLQPFYIRWLSWNCPDECDYQCMWKTVKNFQNRGSSIPQFHGKWPFIRIYGIQEPASVIFSLCNGIAHIIMFFKFRKAVPSSAPMYYIYQFYTIVSVNAWVWSTVFHARDTLLTEMLDYFCADAVVFFFLFVFCARVLVTKEVWKTGSCFAVLASLLVHHIYYLGFIHFDYGYNMKVNLTVGIMHTIGWLWWCSRVRLKQPYVKKAAATVISISLLVLLEVGDFPPLWWMLDAHAIWHACTTPVVFLWHSFTIDDCLFMLKEEQDKLQDKTLNKEDDCHDDKPNIIKEANLGKKNK